MKPINVLNRGRKQSLIQKQQLSVTLRKYAVKRNRQSTYTKKTTKTLSLTTGNDQKPKRISEKKITVIRVSVYKSRGPGFDSRRFQIFWEAAGLERGPLSLVRTTEELLGRKSSGSGQDNRD
jgi:hypothetical protein